uniref:WGS project CBMI000000000 data, contig CS3069_c003255 n=1 Tax=Fusarium clavum TaxID=2594811 RepID=A0A090MHT2_9HYPO|nr:unnamed protein product [Fusarium clavum]CEG05898.1 unnamed protein product [Fusarium clavum]
MIDIQLSQILGTGTSIHDLQQLIIIFHLSTCLNPINLHLNYLISADFNSRILFTVYRTPFYLLRKTKGSPQHQPACNTLTLTLEVNGRRHLGRPCVLHF